MGDICSVVTMGVRVTCIDRSFKKISELAVVGKGAYVCVSNVHMCMEAYDSSEFRAVVNAADWVIPDGRPLSWAQRLLGHSDAEQVRGQDIMNALCESSGRSGLNIGLYGGSSEKVLGRVIERLTETYPDVRITFSLSPPFRELTEKEDRRVVEWINQANVNVLFVGIGCPKQEIWMAEHKSRINCVMLGVGAAFDFVAGSKRHAPKWMQKMGLEWLFRLFSEPTRLWKRYLKQNPRFIYHFSRQWLFNKSYN